MTYWKECVASALEEAGVSATTEQVNQIAGAVEVAHDMYGEAHGHCYIPNPETERADKLQRQLKVEQSKILCQECKGKGSIVTYGPCHSSEHRCWKCHGEGRHTP